MCIRFAEIQNLEEGMKDLESVGDMDSILEAQIKQLENQNKQLKDSAAKTKAAMPPTSIKPGSSASGNAVNFHLDKFTDEDWENMKKLKFCLKYQKGECNFKDCKMAHQFYKKPKSGEAAASPRGQADQAPHRGNSPPRTKSPSPEEKNRMATTYCPFKAKTGNC